MLKIIDTNINDGLKNKIFYYYNLSNDEKKEIENKYQIDFHSILSSLDPEEIGRFEVENQSNLNIIWKMPNTFRIGDLSSFSIQSIGFFIRNDKIVIISNEEIDYFREKCIYKINSIYDFMLYIQNNTIHHYIEHLKVIKMMSREIQEKINTSMENEYLLQMFKLTEILIYYLESINSNKTVLNKMYSYFKISNNDINFDFFNDIIIETEQASKQAEIYTEIFAGLMDARGSIVNNNMNTLIKNLTILNTIFLPLNLIASIGGMSEYSMMTQNIPWPISYGIFMLLATLVAFLGFKILTKMDFRKQNKKYKAKK